MLEGFPKDDRSPPIAHSLLPEGDGQRTFDEGVADRGDGALRAPPVLRGLDQIGCNAHALERVGGAHEVDEEAGLAEIPLPLPPGGLDRRLNACFEVTGYLAFYLGDEGKVVLGLAPIRVSLDQVGKAVFVRLPEVLRSDARVIGAVFDADPRDPHTVAGFETADCNVGHGTLIVVRSGVGFGGLRSGTSAGG